jgi:uncharacterized membrane protein
VGDELALVFVMGVCGTLLGLPQAFAHGAVLVGALRVGGFHLGNGRLELMELVC